MTLMMVGRGREGGREGGKEGGREEWRHNGEDM